MKILNAIYSGNSKRTTGDNEVLPTEYQPLGWGNLVTIKYGHVTSLIMCISNFHRTMGHTDIVLRKDGSEKKMFPDFLETERLV